VLEYSIGEVGLRPDEFWAMTMEEVNLACEGYEVRKAREKEVERLTAAILLNVNRGRGAVVKPEDIYPLITDKKNKGRLITADEMNELGKVIDNAVWQDSD
jgi:hypothetical protein